MVSSKMERGILKSEKMCRSPPPPPLPPATFFMAGAAVARHFALPNAVVTPLRKAASYEPRIAILGIWGDTWLTRGKYGIYVAVRGYRR